MIEGAVLLLGGGAFALPELPVELGRTEAAVGTVSAPQASFGLGSVALGAFAPYAGTAAASMAGAMACVTGPPVSMTSW